MKVQMREMKENDWGAVSSIYQQGMDSNKATFETKCPEYNTFHSSHTESCRLVATQGEQVIGWAALSPVSSRCVYGGVAEVSVYVHEEYQGKGVGSRLLNEIVKLSELDGYWTIQAGIMQDNESSIRLHEKCGFRMVGYREKIGQDRYGNWRNTVLMERRSKQNQ